MEFMKQSLIKITALALISTQIFSGCASIENKYPENATPKAVSFGPSIKGSQSFVRHFDVKERKVFWFFYLVPHSKFSAYELAEKNVGKDEEITNLQIKTQMDVLDCIISIFSIIIGTWSVRVSGDVVKKS